MDPGPAALASTLASKWVETPTAWEQTTKVIVKLRRRVYPDRAETVEAEMTKAHEQLIVARDASDDQVEENLLAAWRFSLLSLLASNPSMADDLRRVVPQSVTGAVEGPRQAIEQVEMRARSPITAGRTRRSATSTSANGDRHAT
ncbi:hypothetical protein [Nonomuraea sp. NPDC050643]|uniref:hypothetical protein n=1 Tax=Nonomuraea sp. NPDC050643 TaxID=3155660 RepID=UPI0033EF0D97